MGYFVQNDKSMSGVSSRVFLVVVLVFNVPPTAKVTNVYGGRAKSHPTDW